MMRRRMMPVRGRGLVGAMATTAVVAGTATVTSNAINNRQQRKAEERYQEEYAQQAAVQSQQEMEQMKAQMQQMQAQQAAAAVPASSGSGDILGQLEKLGQLKASGVLSEQEFQAAKAKLLAA